MLPPASSPEFPSALKARRELIGMSRSELARQARIHGVMPRRYEEVDCGEFSTPRHDTWVALNIALGFAPEAASSGVDAPHASAGHPGTRDTAASVKPLSIAEAKAGLALAFGVSTDRIEITIRG